MKKRYDEGGYIPKSIFNQEGTDIADVGESRVMTSSSEEEPKPKKKPKPARKENYSNEGRSSKPKEEMKQFSSPKAKPHSKLDPYGVVGGAVDKVKGAASSIGDALSSPFRAIREAGNRGNPDAPKKMASGGSASSRADGCAQRGKTRGTLIR
jgi:hypothetical protein